MVKNVYWNTGSSTNTLISSAAYTNEKAKQTVSGYVGLMSTSDWGYAASSSYHSIKISTYSSISNNAISTSWIFNVGREWTSIQNSSTASRALYVTHNGNVTYNGNSYIGGVVRPVVYLDSSVYIVSGEGTEANPYIIGM